MSACGVWADIDANFAPRYFEANRQAILDNWYEWLRMETVGTDPKRLGECVRAAAWLKEFLTPLGFKVDILTPPGGDAAVPPVVVAERPGAAGAATVLFYGHYDVQPEDPLEEWRTPPFEPTLINGRVYARGAQDNKGQVFAFLQGIKALIEAGEALPTLKLAIEGQEEGGGSVALSELAPILGQRLKADVMLVCDTSCAPDGRPAITVGLRGIQSLTVTLTGSSYDLHSGYHGGVAPNPAQGMAALLASLHAPDGAIAVAGFCDGIIPPSDKERELARQNMPSDEQYAREIGCPPVGGAAGFDVAMRRCFMPTIEVNGIHSGYGGPGGKTVIPSVAVAKLSMRLVPGQRPEATFEAVKKHLEAHCPRGMKLTFSYERVGTPGLRLSIDSPVFRQATEVLGKMDTREAIFNWGGASIPIVAQLSQVSGAPSLMVGFGLQEDKTHSPNESFSLEQFKRVMTWSTLILKTLCSQERFE